MDQNLDITPNNLSFKITSLDHSFKNDFSGSWAFSCTINFFLGPLLFVKWNSHKLLTWFNIWEFPSFFFIYNFHLERVLFWLIFIQLIALFCKKIEKMENEGLRHFFDPQVCLDKYLRCWGLIFSTPTPYNFYRQHLLQFCINITYNNSNEQGVLTIKNQHLDLTKLYEILDMI